MRAAVDLTKAPNRHVRINLRCPNAFVTEHFLNDRDRRARVDHVRCEGVSIMPHAA